MADGDAARVAGRAAARGGAAVVALVAVFLLLPFRGDRWWLGVVIGIAILAAMVPWSVLRLRSVVGAERPIAEAFEALVQLLAMLILGFAAVYYAMNNGGQHLRGLETRVDAIYFTTTTLSTVGFGDIAATSQAARAVVTAQILFNLLFVGVVARVFMAAARQRADARS